MPSSASRRYNLDRFELYPSQARLLGSGQSGLVGADAIITLSSHGDLFTAKVIVVKEATQDAHAGREAMAC